MEIKIRKLSPKVVKTLDEMAKEKGFRSREEFLRNHLENITSLELFIELENKYSKVIKATNNIIEKNTEVLSKFMDSTIL